MTTIERQPDGRYAVFVDGVFRFSADDQEAAIGWINAVILQPRMTKEQETKAVDRALDYT